MFFSEVWELLLYGMEEGKCISVDVFIGNVKVRVNGLMKGLT